MGIARGLWEDCGKKMRAGDCEPSLYAHYVEVLIYPLLGKNLTRFHILFIVSEIM